MTTPRSTTRTLIRDLFAAARPTRRAAAKSQPQGHPVRPYIMRVPRTAASEAARVRLVASALRLAALEWECEDTAPLAKMFEDALTDYMREAAPQVSVTRYDYGNGPCDEAYRAIQKAALRLAYTEWNNGRETAGDSMDLDYAQDLLDDALNAYILAASAG
ncbi:hypothetical protein ACRYCC_15335 [Actinomadura scrupuli]|uniref:hypothetical protein n=1 Tax=Actinomadura scrupuli TaxID=559629 RepID=UPI003D971344